MALIAIRYPNQNLEAALPLYLEDFERLALRYSLQEVYNALAELRISPEHKSFMPSPNDVAAVIVEQRELRNVMRRVERETRERIESEREPDRWFWEMVDSDVRWWAKQGTPKTEEEVLDGKGHAGRKRPSWMVAE